MTERNEDFDEFGLSAPALDDRRASCVPDSGKPARKSSLRVRKLAQEVLALNRQMQEQNMPYLLQLADTDEGTNVLMFEKHSGMQIRTFAAELLEDAHPAKDGHGQGSRDGPTLN